MWVHDIGGAGMFSFKNFTLLVAWNCKDLLSRICWLRKHSANFFLFFQLLNAVLCYASLQDSFIFFFVYEKYRVNKQLKWLKEHPTVLIQNCHLKINESLPRLILSLHLWWLPKNAVKEAIICLIVL